MNHAAARTAVDGLFVGRAKRLAELRAHLDSCLECRAHYDRTARAFRALSGRPEQMTPEELLLFAPALPEAEPAKGRWPALWAGALATAVAAALVLYVGVGKPDEFQPRGSTPVAGQSGTRALCSRSPGVMGDAVDGACASGDRLAFVANPRGKRFAAVALVDGDTVEVVVSGPQGAIEAGETEAVLANSSTWRPGLTGVAMFSDEPIEPEVAQKCARGDCPSSVERTEIPLGPAR